MSNTTGVAIIGAGPYGLSLAAHLLGRGIKHRIYGKPMGMWQTQMPDGMMLKSEGFASSLSHPDGAFTLKDYCQEQGIPYADIGIPVTRDIFVAYGLEFQRRFAHRLEQTMVTKIVRDGAGFQLTFDDGSTSMASQVVVAVGISHFQYIPPVLASLSPDRLSHSSRHNNLSHLQDKKVVVIGGGSSAVDIAIHLDAVGSHPELVTRRSEISFHNPPEKTKRPLHRRIRYPRSGLGVGWPARLAEDVPLLFHKMPVEFRFRTVHQLLGPSAGWTTKEKVLGRIPVHTGLSLKSAAVENNHVRLTFQEGDGSPKELTADHVVAGTGYKTDLRRLPFIDQNLYRDISSVEESPILSKHFESSVPGLYFVGASAANSFGPLLRFACGAEFTSRHLSKHLSSMGTRIA